MCQKLWVCLKTKFLIFYRIVNLFGCCVKCEKNVQKTTTNITQLFGANQKPRKSHKRYYRKQILSYIENPDFAFDFSNFLSNHLWLKMYTLSDVQIKLKFKSHTTCPRLVRITKNKAFLLELTVFSINSKMNLNYLNFWSWLPYQIADNMFNLKIELNLVKLILES